MDRNIIGSPAPDAPVHGMPAFANPARFVAAIGPDTATSLPIILLFQDLRRRWRARETARLLGALDDALLKDIGVCRSAIPWHARQQHAGDAAQAAPKKAVRLLGWTARRGIGATLTLSGGAVAMAGYAVGLQYLHGPTVQLPALLGILIAATCSSVAGFAFSALCGAILFHLIGTPVLAVEIMLWCSIAIQLTSVLALRHSIDWRSLLQFLAGGVIGLPIGVYALLHLGKSGFGSALGGILIAYGAWRVWHPAPPVRFTSARWNVAAGAVGGLTGGLAAFPGAAVTICCGLKGWDKVRQRGVYQPYILVMQLLTVLLLAIAPQAAGVPRSFDPTVLAYIPAALAGTLLGLRFFQGLTDRQFGLAMNLLLMTAGAGMQL